MSKATQEPAALWKQFLGLGEDLLSQSNAASVTRLLCDRISSQFHCQTGLYLVEPSYPLPGEIPVSTIPTNPAPALVEKVFNSKPIQPYRERNGQNLAIEIALPLITQDTLLAILHVVRPQDDPFTQAEIELLEGIASFAAVSMQTNRQVALKNWRYDQIALVRSVSAQIANLLDLDELCQKVTSLIQCSFNFYFVSIFTIEEGSDLLHFRASSTSCDPKIELPKFSARLGEGLIGDTAKTGHEHVSKDISQDPLFRVIEELPETKSEATLPLIVENRILGVMDIQSNKLESFHENDILVLRSLADNIALAVEGARLYNNLEKRAEQMKAVLEINNALSSILDLDSLLEEIVQVIHERFNYPFVHIFTVHPGRRKVIYQTGSGMRSRHLHSNAFAYDLDASKGLIPLVARTGKAILCNDVTQEPLYLPSKLPPHDTRSELTIPLVFGKDVLGILDLQSDQVNSFDSQDLLLFEGLAAGIAVSLRNATLFRSERWRRQVADSFQDVAGLLSANIELSDLLEKILSELEKNLPCDASAIWLLEEVKPFEKEDNKLLLAAVHGAPHLKIITARTESEEVRKFLDHSLSSSTPLIRKPNGPYGPLGYACNFPKNYSSLAVPLRAGGKVLGVLTLAHHIDGRYGSEAAAISATFANYAAVAIQNARLFSSAQEDAWSSTVLLQVSEATQSIGSEEELLATMNRLTPLLVGIDKCAFYLFDSIHSSYELKTWYGFHPSQEERVVTEEEAIPFLKLQTTRAPVFILDPVSELKLPSLQHSEVENTVVMLPLISRGEILGAFLVSHSTQSEFGVKNPFKDQTLAILQGITQQIAVALENIRLVETRQEDAYITAVLLQVAQAVVSQNNLSDILDTIVHLMPILVGIETCVIYLWDKKDQKFIPSQAIAENHKLREWLNQTSFLPSEYFLLDELQQTQKMVVCELDDANLPPEEWTKVNCRTLSEDQIEQLQAKNCWLIGFPLSIKGEFLGALVAVENNVPAKFQSKRIELLNGVTQQISLAIQDDHLNQEVIDRERMEKEIQLARQIQKTFLPERLPTIEGWNLDLRWTTAREVGGDFYDVFTTQHNKLAIAIADVSDKGMPAALYMTVTRTLIRSSAQSIHSPAKVLERVNELLAVDNTQNGMFVTAVFAILDPENGSLEYAIAGHNLPMLFKANSQQVEQLQKGGMALGVVEDAKYVDQTIILEKGDTLLLYTDGVTETFSPTEELFSEPRLIETLKEACLQNEKAVLEVIENKIESFRLGGAISDDVTMINIHRNE